MVSVSGEEAVEGDGQEMNSSNAHEFDKIYVAVRVRPLNDREISKNDLSDWECINNTTIIFKNTLQERSLLPSAYTFDRVFGFNSPTKHVYEEAAKKIALSVLGGINSTIFAYGQTGSGKTFTMCGITECAIADIYDYVHKHRHERKFVLKFSAMEIYNEAVKDLLRSDGTALRLLDDPERGTIVDKLTEVTLKDSRQLKELLSICEAQRRIGETNLNEVSSRSHQILRLTVESEALQYLGARNPSSLTAAVNFVDLAGSERASQTLSGGARLKEGCHINRSLLSLGTVIRKLSKGRNGHIPYRDSKLTRILQNALGGNARTAIICTMSPAHTHVEQSRNTLHFANCAKQVSTNAQVNVVMSEKALVKQLQKELARLESELKKIQSHSHSTSGISTTALKEKELLIQKMDQEMRELINQRDMAQSRVEDMMRSGGEHTPKSWSHDGGSWTDEYSASEASEIMDPLRLDVISRASNSGRYQGKIEDQFLSNNEDQFLSNSLSPRLCIDKYFGPDPCQGWERISQQTNNSRNNSSIETDSNRRSSFSRNSLSRNSVSMNSFSSASSPRTNSPRTSSPRMYSPRDRAAGQSLTSLDFDASDLSARTDRTKSCEAILASIMNGPSLEAPKENEKIIPHSETIPIQEKISGKKTLAALLRENSLRLSDAKMQSITDSLSRQKSGKLYDAKKQSDIDALSRQNSGKLSDARKLSNNEALSRQNSRNPVRGKSSSEEQYIESPRKDCTDKQQEVRVKEVNVVVKPKAVKQTGQDLETNKERTISHPKESAEGKSKKEKTSSNTEETAGGKGKKERTASMPEQVTEGKTKKERKSSCPEETAPSKSKKERTVSCPEDSAGGKTKDTEVSATATAEWKAEFERRKREIIELWDACHIPLVHRSYFYLLFKGDPSDAVYMEVEHRRLSFLKTGGKDSNDEVPSSPKALQREREMLSRRMLKKLTAKEREALYQKWGIDVKTKQRRLQLCRKLWTDTKDMGHINESAAIVGKLAGLKEAGKAPKEMFGLSLVPKQSNSRSFSWRHPIPSII